MGVTQSGFCTNSVLKNVRTSTFHETHVFSQPVVGGFSQSSALGHCYHHGARKHFHSGSPTTTLTRRAAPPRWRAPVDPCGRSSCPSAPCVVAGSSWLPQSALLLDVALSATVKLPRSDPSLCGGHCLWHSSSVAVVVRGRVRLRPWTMFMH